MSGATWKRCSSCKKDIGFEATYYLCNVSTCKRKRTGFVFCSVECWEVHLPMMRHREAWAEEEKAPSKAQWEREQAGEGKAERKSKKADRPTPTVRRPHKPAAPPGQPGGPRRQVVTTKPPPKPEGPKEVLVIASRLKNYVRVCYGINTSDSVFEVLSEELRNLCDEAARRAIEAGRKTLLDRDF